MVIGALGLSVFAVHLQASNDARDRRKAARAAAYKDVSAIVLTIDRVRRQAMAKRSKDGRSAEVSV
ncbi:hypothetical protein AB0I84_29470 [Streptomyces spectabilis]|uniref:hypothetical protein n=1 Tax=Streptomyces spectabilis TaxID=68270 RepID=UPI0033D1971F